MQVKAARRKKHLCIILNIQQNLNFPAPNWWSGICFGFCKEENWAPQYKTDSKWLKDQFLKVR